ncbi:claudin-14 [Periophthalmus magnuspinnatus]|uniref:claudin-14 n=1 Tax=Periophthalmus magnuspinnatus TaxID=409849 RepID=UPI002436745B|nr:claudin-14 [Periophthalmus magnuspinnatus]
MFLALLVTQHSIYTPSLAALCFFFTWGLCGEGSRMVSQGIQMMGICMSVIGWLMVLVVCALPMWKVTAFIGANIITAQTIWQGMWMNCVVQSTGQMQCKVYDSMLALPQDLQAARAMIIISILAGIAGVLLAIAGAKCTNCIAEERAKAKTCIVSGILFIVSGLLCLIPVSWTANTIVHNFYNPLVLETQRYELGASLTKMGRVGKEVAGQVLSFIGLVGVSVTCGVPMWRVTSFIGANIVTGQIVWDGLWMNCVMQSTGQMQCRINDSVMRLTRDLQAARALIIISLVVGFIGFMISFLGAKCTSCLKKQASMANVVIIAGCLIILAAVLDLIPVCWSAAITISDFQNPLTIETQRREIGASIYIGWGSAAFLLIGGIILTTSCPPRSPFYGYPPQPGAYPYIAPSNQGGYRPVYTPVSQPYSGSYVPTKPYAAPSAYSGGQYI